MKFLIVLTVLFSILISCTKKTTENLVENAVSCENKEIPCVLTNTKMNGVSFVNVNYAIDASDVQPVKAIHATWVTTMPFLLFRMEMIQFSTTNLFSGMVKQEMEL